MHTNINKISRKCCFGYSCIAVGCSVRYLLLFCFLTWESFRLMIIIREQLCLLFAVRKRKMPRACPEKNCRATIFFAATIDRKNAPAKCNKFVEMNVLKLIILIASQHHHKRWERMLNVLHWKWCLHVSDELWGGGNAIKQNRTDKIWPMFECAFQQHNYHASDTMLSMCCHCWITGVSLLVLLLLLPLPYLFASPLLKAFFVFTHLLWIGQMLSAFEMSIYILFKHH